MGFTRVGWLALLLSLTLAVAYGADSDGWVRVSFSQWAAASLKASGIIVLVALASVHRSHLLAIALSFGAAGDFLLAAPLEWGFLAGALAFLVGHLFYIALFLRTGPGLAALKQPPRLLAALVLIAAAVGMTYALVPRDSPMFVPLGIYTGVLTLMTLTAFTLPATRGLAIAGAVLFFISDGFVAWNMFHPDPDPTFAFWRSFAGWMIYWAGQAGICMGMASFALRKPRFATD